ncbi:MAG: hypothetical protein U1E34_00930 [Amaricoccus sp.]
MGTLDPAPGAAEPGGVPTELAEIDTDTICDFLLNWYDRTKIIPFPGCEFSVKPIRDHWRHLLVATGH